VVESGGGERLRLRAYVTERGTKSFELVSLFGQIEVDPSGHGVVEAEIPRSELEFYAARLLSVGTDVRVESPLELIDVMRRKAEEIMELYRQGSNS
jgi:predicted DNA-binding transcriptional regulator YafY